MSGFGGMLSFELEGEAKDAIAFLKRLKLITPAVSLGGVETLICCPAQTSHSKISVDERRRIGISDSLIRLSAGIENPADLIEDLANGLKN
jgi:cystathionine beta-lyase